MEVEFLPVSASHSMAGAYCHCTGQELHTNSRDHEGLLVGYVGESHQETACFRKMRSKFLTLCMLLSMLFTLTTSSIMFGRHVNRCGAVRIASCNSCTVSEFQVTVFSILLISFPLRFCKAYRRISACSLSSLQQKERKGCVCPSHAGPKLTTLQ